tara:strand:+ start:2093 stop:4348 length:2256 start_codon:yes stop_codon:yes gene_type:complete
MIITKQMFKNLIYCFFYLLFSSQTLLSKELKFDGLSKLNLQDIQTLTTIDIFTDDILIEDINITLKELYLSDLIYDVSYSEFDNHFLISINESDLIQNIYINKNVWIKDDIIIQNLNSNKNLFLIKENVQTDIKIIKNMYRSKGFKDILVSAKVERFSDDRINLIYEVEENSQQKITLIKFFGNKYFSENYLKSIIQSQGLKFYNIFKSGSNLNYPIFEFDKNKIISTYRDEGFSNIEVSYLLEKGTFNTNILNFYINEGDRLKIDNIDFNFDNEVIPNVLDETISKLNDKLRKNNYFYSKSLVNEHIELFNLGLLNNNIHNKSIEVDEIYTDKLINLKFYFKPKEPIIVSKIDITGNSITKDKTIRSKLSFEPGQYLDQFTIEKSTKILKKYPYIKDVTFDTLVIDKLANVTIDIDEETKTGNLLLAGTFNPDTGAGVSFGIEDKNIFGSGNSLNSNFILNSEDIKFDINYVQYPILNPNLTNTYTAYNQDNDYTNSFGYKASRRGLGYSINFNQSDKLSYGVGINYETFKGHSAVNSSSASIIDNIGNFENFKLNFSIKYDTSNNYFNPTNGIINNLDISYSPENISDNSFYKILLSNKNYMQLNNSKNYLFLNNKYGFSESLDSKLKTIDSFALGGLNFRGFDYRGIGPYDGNIYLGGNEFFTSTIGYGSSFIFDDKDNINIKFFMTTGSIWNSDYSNSSDIDLRTSIGASFDFITAVGPISFSYAIPLEKNDSDRNRSFNFSIGSSF